jgi:hypothetical protein
MGRTMVIGDIHGCYDELTMLWKERGSLRTIRLLPLEI